MNLQPITLSIPEAAAYVRISPSSLRRAVERGEIPHIKIGARVLIPKAALDALVGDASS